MESYKKKIPFSYSNNIPKNLFHRQYPKIENKKYSSKEKPKITEIKPNQKYLKSFIYFHKKPVQIENKKEQIIKKVKEIIDSKTDIRLPLEYVDLSYDNPKNE